MPRNSTTTTTLLGAVALATLLFAAPSPAREADFNRGWKFTKGDPAGAERVVFDDVAWETVRTPHDWAIAGPFDPEVDGHAGKLPWQGVGWYRKWLMLDGREEGSRVYLDFDGVMASPQVYVNGRLAGSWDYGYTPFRIDVTPLIRFGRANVVAVRVDTSKMETRWYPGAGIYRKVTLSVSPPAHLTHGGTMVTTPEVDGDTAKVIVTNEIENHLPTKRPAELVVSLVSPEGETVSQSTEPIVIDPVSIDSVGAAKTRHEFRLEDVRRWDIESPSLYTAVTELRVDGRVVDRRETPFGVRSFRFTADDGFLLNGRRVEIRGVNLHHDLGPLGAAFNRRAAERQLEIMRDMGANAIRTSHNPPAAELLDLCDRMGLLVWDELFDKWNDTSGRVGGTPSFEDHVARHARAFVRRDRNHPSVVVWSIGNEILNQPHDPEGKTRERVRFARQEFRRHDTTRPVGLGCFIPHTADTDILADLDLTGWNYQRRYALFRDRYPDKPIVYSETASALSTRGFYELPLPDNKCGYSDSHQVNSYELLAAPWADIPEVEFERLRRDRYIAGEFVWTGFDYLGEPTPFSQVARSSYFGIVDLVGLPKNRYHLYRSLWKPDEATVHIAPHWNWPDRLGEPTPVTVYTNGDSAELFLNGRSLGVRRKGEAPEPAEDVAADASVATSTHEPGTDPGAVTATQGSDLPTEWQAAPDDQEAWIEVDLGRSRSIESVALTFPHETKYYDYRIEASLDGGDWQTLLDKPASRQPRWGGVHEVIHPVSATADKLRLSFGRCLDGKKPGLVKFSAYESEYESTYYRETYDYRLRWKQVAYEPGELKAVAYRDGERLGEAVVRTAGEPARLVLSADRSDLVSDGEDTAFVTVTAVDANGVPCPLASHDLSLATSWPGVIAGAGNGNPLSLDPFQDDRVQLFYGKAVVLIRAVEGEGGPIELRVDSAELPDEAVRLRSGR